MKRGTAKWASRGRQNSLKRAFGERAARPPHDGGHDLVLGQFGGHRKHRRVADVGMTEQHLLDFERRNIFAAAADGVLQPVDKAEIAVGLADDAVAGVKPAVAESLGGLVGHGEIAGSEGELLVAIAERVRPARLGLASLPSWSRTRA